MSDRLNRGESVRGKSDGMTRVAQGKEDSILRGIEVIKWLAVRYSHITCDDTWARGLEVTGDARVLGVIFHQAALLGIIRKTPHYICTIQKKSHRAPVQVWESVPYRGNGEAAPFVERSLYSRIIEVQRRQETQPPARPRSLQALRSGRVIASRRKRRQRKIVRKR